MNRLIELLLGLHRGFLSREGELSIQFHPQWPGQEIVGPQVWNIAFAAAAAWVVWYVYRREGRGRSVRVTLGVIRLLLLGLVLALLNRPVLTLGQSRTEPSILAVMIDDSISMRVRDAASSGAAKPVPRLDAISQLLTDANRKLLTDLSAQHEVKLYVFDRNARPLPEIELATLKPEGQQTRVLDAIGTVLDELQGQRIAGVVLLSDGRETPQQPSAEALARLKDRNVKVYPVPVGSDRAPVNVEVQSVSVQDSAFKGDIVNLRAVVRGSGFGGEGNAGREVVMRLLDGKTGQPLPSPSGSVEQRVTLGQGDLPVEVELQFKPENVGTLDVIVEAAAQPGELDDEDNARVAQIEVIDAKIAVLYVDGYPRWEYRYIKNEMIRDATVDISCLLTSADPSFAQEGDRPIRRFPESIEELMEYDVVLFGDVEPRQFTDTQLQLITDFVSKRGGGFGMIAGPRWSPAAYRNTAIEPILPVTLPRQREEPSATALTEGFRPALTKEGEASGIFRFFADREANAKFLRDMLQPIFWYSRGVTAKPGVGVVYAHHPEDVGPDGRKAPLLVLGRFGAGHTLFSAIDDSWRWRFYTGESLFDTYWVQQLRHLARSKKLGQRRMTFTSSRQTFELGQQVRLTLRLLDPQLAGQLPDQIRVEIVDADGRAVRQEMLVRQESERDTYVASFSAEAVGRFVARLPPLAGGVGAMELPLEVSVPRLELAQPEVDRTALSRLASETGGQVIEFADAAAALPRLIPSAARVIPLSVHEPLWDAPLALALFVLLVTVEWVARKIVGMV